MIEQATLITQAASSPWAITPEYLEIIRAVLSGEGESPEAVSMRLGRPLQNTRKVEMRDDVAVIPVLGPIFRRANLFTELSGATSTQVLATDFQSAIDNPEVGSIVLNVSSPGGQAEGIPELARAIREQRGAKPIVAYVEGMGASAAYWLATAASEIVLSEIGMVGSIGAVAGFRVSNDKDRIEVVSRQSPKKRLAPGSDEALAELQTQIDQVAQVFVDTIAANRNTEVETVLQEFGEGGMLVGRQALAVGMVDRLGSLEEVIAGLSGSTIRSQSFMTTATYKASDITRDVVAEQFPGIADALRTEGVESIKDERTAEKTGEFDKGIEEGKKLERERLAALDDLVMPGCEALIEQCKADGKTTAPEASEKIVKHLKAAQGKKLKDIETDSPAGLPAASGDDSSTESTQDFDTLVTAKMTEAKVSKGDAVRLVVKEAPEAYAAYRAKQRAA